MSPTMCIVKHYIDEELGGKKARSRYLQKGLLGEGLQRSRDQRNESVLYRRNLGG